ncbi:MAG TPA: ester cyclase [Azospirillaceae bacterium]|nr:ester cyclase [Azospirillaceae bacterium]
MTMIRRDAALTLAAAPALLATAAEAAPAATPAAVVRGFIEDVRSGRDPDAAHRYMAPHVLAHQLTAENEAAVERTPADYADHIREFLRDRGAFTLEITEFLADGDRVYVRWRQTGRDLEPRDGKPATGRPLVEIASAVYRVAEGRIAEYWIQIDRKGLELQLAA